jgi:hypothetical protein
MNPAENAGRVMTARKILATAAPALMALATVASAEISVSANAIDPKEMTTEQTQFLNAAKFFLCGERPCTRVAYLKSTSPGVMFFQYGGPMRQVENKHEGEIWSSTSRPCRLRRPHG